MTGPTMSRVRSWNIGSPAFCSASSICRDPCSRLVPCSAVAVCGSRIMIWRSPAGPYCCTTLSPGMLVIAERTWSSVTGCANCTMTRVPPEKSMPSDSPRVAITAAPAMMTASDSAMACQRQRMKL